MINVRVREVRLGAPGLHVPAKRPIQNSDHTYTRRTIQIRTNSKQSKPHWVHYNIVEMQIPSPSSVLLKEKDDDTYFKLSLPVILVLKIDCKLGWHGT